MGLAQDAEALGLEPQGAKAEVGGAELQVQGHASIGLRIRRELGPVAEDGGELPGQEPPGRDEPVGLRRHIEGQGLNGRGGGAVLRHNLREGGEEGQSFGGLPRPSVIHVAFALHVRVRGQDHLRPEVAHDPGDSLHHVFKVVEAAIAEIEEAHVGDAQGLGRSHRFRFTQVDQLLRRGSLGRVFEAVAAVGADEETDLLPRSGQLGRRGPGADLDVVRMGAQEQVSVEGLHLGGGGGEAQGKTSQAHACFASRRAFSSAQIRSYSGSSRV